MIHPDVIDALVAAGATAAMIAAAYRADCLATPIPRPLDNGATQPGPPIEPKTQAQLAGGPTASTSTARVRRHRAKRAAVAPQPDLFRATLAVDNTRNDETHETPVSTVSETQRKFPPITPFKESLAAADASARAPPSKSLISPEAFALADKVRDLMRIDPDDTRAVGMAYQVQEWLTKGWRAEIVLQAVETVMARLKGVPPRRLAYFEAPIAEAHANAARPLPKANLKPVPTVTEFPHVARSNPTASDWGARRDARHAALAKLNASVAALDLAEGGGRAGSG